MGNNNLNREIKSGGKWLILNQVVSQLIKVSFSIALARILLPSDFGAFAKVISLIGFAELFLKLGLSSAIIQDEEISASQISSIFWIFLLIGFMLTLIIFNVTPLIIYFYNDSSIDVLIKLCSLNFLIVSVGIVPLTLLRKYLRFKELFYIQVASTVLSGVIATITGLNGMGALSLAFQFIGFNLFNCIFSFWIVKYVPGLSFNLYELKNHIYFGAKVFFNDLLGYLGRNSDNFLIGKYQGDAALGYYNRAYALMFAPLIQVNQVFINLLFPSISKLKEDKKTVQGLFIKIQRLIVVFVIPWLIYGFFSSKGLVITFLGVEWLPSVIIFQLLIWVGVVHSFTSINSSIYMAYNKMDIPVKISLISKPILITAIYIFAQQGIIEVALGVMVIMIFSSLILYVQAIKIIELSINNNIKKLKVEFIGIISLSIALLIMSYFNISFWQVNLIPLILFYLAYYIVRPNFFKELFKIALDK